jgi:hypothetical protein
MKRPAALLLIGFFLIITILTLVASRLSAQSVFIPEMPTINTAHFTIPVQYNVPGLRRVEWKQTIGSAIIVNPYDKFPQITGAVDGDYRFDVFATDSTGTTFTDWVPVTVRGVGSVPSVVIPRDTIYRDTCGLNWMALNDLSFVILLPEIGGTAYLPDSTAAYKAMFGAAPPHQRFKDDASIRVYRFSRTYVVNGKSQSVRFTLYKTGAWIREIKDAAGVWQVWDY